MTFTGTRYRPAHRTAATCPRIAAPAAFVWRGAGMASPSRSRTSAARRRGCTVGGTGPTVEVMPSSPQWGSLRACGRYVSHGDPDQLVYRSHFLGSTSGRHPQNRPDPRGPRNFREKSVTRGRSRTRVPQCYDAYPLWLCAPFDHHLRNERVKDFQDRFGRGRTSDVSGSIQISVVRRGHGLAGRSRVIRSDELFCNAECWCP
jgi:hypothetical protein